MIFTTYQNYPLALIIDKYFSIFIEQCLTSSSNRRVPGDCERMHRFAWNSFVLAGACIWSPDTYINLLPIYHLCALFVRISCRASRQISYPAIFFYNANGIFNLWEFYCSCPCAGNEQSIYLVSFSPGCTHTHPSAGHMIKWSWSNLISVDWLLSLSS